MAKLTLFRMLISYNILFGHLTTVDHEMRLLPVVAIMTSSIRLASGLATKDANLRPDRIGPGQRPTKVGRPWPGEHE